jgi:flagellar biogenesis protein FliO
MVMTAAKMILGLGGVLAVLWALLTLSRRGLLGRRPPAASRAIRFLATKAIGPQQFITLVEVGGQVLVLGVGGPITLLDKVTDPGVVDKILDEGGRPVRPPWWGSWPNGRKAAGNEPTR